MPSFISYKNHASFIIRLVWFAVSQKSMVIHSWSTMLRHAKLPCDRNKKKETNALWFQSVIKNKNAVMSHLALTKELPFFHDVFFDPLHYHLRYLEAHSDNLSSSLIGVMHPQIKTIDRLEVSIFMHPNYMLNPNRPECCHSGSDIPYVMYLSYLKAIMGEKGVECLFRCYYNNCHSC